VELAWIVIPVVAFILLLSLFSVAVKKADGRGRHSSNADGGYYGGGYYGGGDGCSNHSGGWSDGGCGGGDGGGGGGGD
jgi:uncharacterized protein